MLGHIPAATVAGSNAARSPARRGMRFGVGRDGFAQKRGGLAPLRAGKPFESTVIGFV